MKAEAIILGAGQGRRMEAVVPKVLLPLGPYPVLMHSIIIFSQSPEIEGIILVVPEKCESEILRWCRQIPGGQKVRAVVPGGARRQDSVQAGLDQVMPSTEFVLVHDAARPFVTLELIGRVLQATVSTGAAIPGIPVVDTLKIVEAQRSMVVKTLERRNVVAVQTPQGFQTSRLRQALAYAWQQKLSITDEAALFEQLTWPVSVVAGDPRNFKITTPQDYQFAQWLQESK